MNLDDYKRMIEDYQNQIEILNAKIEEKEKLRRYHKFPKAAERNDNNGSLLLLYDMRNDCIYAVRKLIEQCESMEKKNNEC